MAWGLLETKTGHRGRAKVEFGALSWEVNLVIGENVNDFSFVLVHFIVVVYGEPNDASSIIIINNHQHDQPVFIAILKMSEMPLPCRFWQRELLSWMVPRPRLASDVF